MYYLRLKDEELMAMVDAKAEELESLWRTEKKLLAELDELTNEMFRRGMEKVNKRDSVVD